MADAELEAIRKARLEQLKAQGGAGGPGGGAGGPGGQGQNADAQKEAESEARSQILNQILHPEAADRLGRIRLVREDRATDVENRLIMLARSGQLRQKVTEQQLKELLEAVSESSREQEKIVVARRKGWEDEDEDDDFFD
ncbi:putative Programmed cell death protein 5 [Seiridium cardinale]|uniref:Programmed cell death protein 5 n=1 Tax=Seiridium cardinale TaxID=138064 RepID=A0ABR2XN84_9PEZI